MMTYVVLSVIAIMIVFQMLVSIFSIFLAADNLVMLSKLEGDSDRKVLSVGLFFAACLDFLFYAIIFCLVMNFPF